MLRRLFVAGLVSGALVAASGSKPAEAYVSVDVNLHFGSDTFWFDHAPRFVAVPYSPILYAPSPDCDIYRYGDWYYVNNGYDWYRAPGYAGPFQRISYVAVPQSIVTVPVRYRHYAGHYVTRDPWASRWRNSGDRNDDGGYARDGRSYDGDGSSRGRDGGRDDRWAQRGHGGNDDQGHGHGKGKKRGHGNGRAYGRS